MQDQAFVEIGKIVLEEMGNKEPYQLFIQNMSPDKSNYKMIVAVFEISEDGGEYSCRFKHVDVRNVNSENYLKYAYRKGASNGGDVTFTTKFGDINKKFRTLVEKQFKVLLRRFQDKNSTEYRVFKSVYDYLTDKEHFDFLKAELSGLYDNLPKEDQTTSGLSMVFIVNGKEMHLADFEIIQSVLHSHGTEGKSTKYGVTSAGKDAMCSVCMEEKPVVHGFASPFKYATVDKPGMVSGFFNQANNWKNYPICSDCSLLFELGRTYVLDHLSSYFYGKAYYLIPKTLLSRDSKNLKKALTKLTGLYSDLSKTAVIKRKEDILEKHIADKKEDYYNVNLLFYEENATTKAMKIKLFLEEILPSRFHRLFVKAPAAINENALYKNALTIKKERHDLVFNMGVLKTFFDDDFYDVIQKVFTLKKFSQEALYKRFMDVIRTNYNKMAASESGYVERTDVSVLKAHLTIAYLHELDLIENYSSGFIMETAETESAHKGGFDVMKLRSFVSENASFLNTGSKVGVFAVGALVRLVLGNQYANLKNTPFEKKLRGYNLNASLLQNIYLEALNKLSQYQGFYAYSNLRDFIGEFYLLNSEEIRKMSNNELSFYFVAGMEFAPRFKNEKDKDPESVI